jgi:hypothetical protein
MPPSSATSPPGIAIQISQWVKDSWQSVISRVPNRLAASNRVVSATVSICCVVHTTKCSCEAAFFSSSAISEIVCDASSVFLVGPGKPLLPIPLRTVVSAAPSLGKRTTETIGRQLTHMLRKGEIGQPHGGTIAARFHYVKDCPMTLFAHNLMAWANCTVSPPASSSQLSSRPRFKRTARTYPRNTCFQAGGMKIPI